MTALDRAIATASTPELKATRRVLHMGGNYRSRAGWIDREWPAVLEATCAAISAELTTRGDPFGPCPPCQVGTSRLAVDERPSVASGAPGAA